MLSKRSPLPLVPAILALLLAACGTSSHGNLTGRWSATANTNVSTMNSGRMLSPMLSFTFSLVETPTKMINSASPATGALSISNLNFTNGNGCFDNMTIATVATSDMARNSQSLTLTLSENGNTAMFSMAVSPTENSASGNFALTGGNTLSGAATSCMVSASGAAMFTRQ